MSFTLQARLLNVDEKGFKSLLMYITKKLYNESRAKEEVLIVFNIGIGL